LLQHSVELLVDLGYKVDLEFKNWLR